MPATSSRQDWPKATAASSSRIWRFARSPVQSGARSRPLAAMWPQRRGSTGPCSSRATPRLPANWAASSVGWAVNCSRCLRRTRRNGAPSAGTPAPGTVRPATASSASRAGTPVTRTTWRQGIFWRPVRPCLWVEAHGSPRSANQPAPGDSIAGQQESRPFRSGRMSKGSPVSRPSRLILASASPRRRELLAKLGIPFEVVVADVSEHEDPATHPRVMVAHNAALKADWVAERNPDAVVLGADTTVFLDGSAINKPRDLDEARSMLRRLSGRGRPGLRVDRAVSSFVEFKPFGDAVIEDYIRLVNTLDKAGAYSIQEQTDMIIARYRGSFSNIMGLPIEATKQILTGDVLLG